MMEREQGVEFPLVEADAGDTAGLPSESFDIAFSEYGASIWGRPRALGCLRGRAAPSAPAAA